MAKSNPPSGPRPIHEGYSPSGRGYGPLEKGYSPSGKPQSGHQPTTGQGGPSGPPPNQGSSVAPPKSKP